jgi:hypothetical protein
MSAACRVPGRLQGRRGRAGLLWFGVIATILRILLGSTVSAGIHTYLWLRLVRPAHLPRRWHVVATVGLVVMFLSIPLTTSRMYAPGLASTLGWISLPWMALGGLTFVALVAIDVARLVAWLGRRAMRQPPEVVASLSRRTFLTRVTGGAALAVGGSSVATGMFEARGEHEIVDVEVKLAKLPRALDGFRSRISTSA